ncbi:hypothetical protein, partial [Mesorhizobium sp.]|uniref:hypothetical protein n=1 Tax=Mesorhizobium sp. TaxID=1871066 RepID=UPI0025C35AB1
GEARSEATRADPRIHAVTVESHHGPERSSANPVKQLAPFWIGLLDHPCRWRDRRFSDFSQLMLLTATIPDRCIS